LPARAAHPAWLVAERLAAEEIPHEQLAADRADFFRLWADVSGGGIFAGRVEMGVRGVESGEAIGRPMWLQVSRSGATSPYDRSEGLPGVRVPEAVLISPVACRTREAGRQWRAEHLSTGWPWLIVDIDKKDAINRNTTVDRILDAIRPRPTLVVRSGGGGAHVWWALTSPLPQTPAVELNKRLAALYCGDPMQARGRPSLRLPGTLNVKWLEWPVQVRPCSIDRERSDFDRRYTAADFERLPIVHRWRPERRLNVLDISDTPPWIANTLKAAGCEKLSNVQRFFQGVSRPVCVPDVCPVCHQRGTAWVYVDEPEPRLGCHRRSCEGWPSVRRVAEGYGIDADLPNEGPIEDTYRDADLEAVLVPPAAVSFSAEARAEEQAACSRAAKDAWEHAQRLTDPRRILWVVESSVGVGKDYTLLREAEEVADLPSRWDIYAKSQKHLRDKVFEWPTGDRALRVHISPIALEGPKGERCLKMAEMRANSAKGWEASRVCGTCEHAATCEVKKGFAEMGGPLPPPVDLYTTRRLEAVGPVAIERPTWVDESFSLVHSTITERDELQRFSRSGVVPKQYRDLARALLHTWAMLPDCATDPLTPVEWAPEYADLPEPTRPRKTRRPVGIQPLFPRWIFELVCEAWHMVKGRNRGFLLWFRGDKATLWRRTLDRLPRASLWTNATFWVWADVVYRAPDLEVRRLGRRLEPRYLTRMHYPYREAVRGGYAGTEKLLMVDTATGKKRGNIKHLEVTKAAVKAAVDRWYRETEGGEDTRRPRVLVATYQPIAQEGYGDGPEEFCKAVGADAVDYYERLVGTNDYEGWEVLVMLGAPNPALDGSEPAIEALYGMTRASVMARRSQEAMEQTVGRLRAVYSSSAQVVMAVTPTQPITWAHNCETVVDPMGVWVDVAKMLGVWSVKDLRAFSLIKVSLLQKAEQYRACREYRHLLNRLSTVKEEHPAVFDGRIPLPNGPMVSEIAALAGLVSTKAGRKGPRFWRSRDPILSACSELLGILAKLSSDHPAFGEVDHISKRRQECANVIIEEFAALSETEDFTAWLKQTYKRLHR
jgi:hypothetical protein